MATISSSMDNQSAFNRELITLGAGALVAGLTASILQLIAGASIAPLSALSFGAVIGLAASLMERREGASSLRLILGLIAGGVMALAGAAHPLFGAFLGGGILGAALSIGEGGSSAKRALIVLAYAVALVGGVYTAQTLLQLGFLRALGELPVVSELTRAGLWGTFLMVPAGLKLLEWREVESLRELRESAQQLKKIAPQHAELLRGAAQTYERVLDELDREEVASSRSRAEQIAQEVARGLVALTRRAVELEQAVARTTMRPLEQRAHDLERRARDARDPALRRELLAALSEVVEQMRARRRMEAACVRIEARQQRFITALERLHVTLVQNDRLVSDDNAISLSLDELSRLTEEVRWQNLSLDELCGPEAHAIDDELDDADLNALLAELDAVRGSASVPAPSARPVTAPARTVAAPCASPPRFAPQPQPPLRPMAQAQDDDEEEVVFPDGVDGSLAASHDEEVSQAQTSSQEQASAHIAPHSR